MKSKLCWAQFIVGAWAVLTVNGGDELDCFAVRLAAPENTIPARQYPPDRVVDLQHLILDVTPDFQRRTIAAKAILSFKPIAKPLSELELDAIDLNVRTVTGSVPVAGHHVSAEKLIVTFEKPVPVGEDVRLTIDYTAEPKKGLYFRTPEMGYEPGEAQLFTQGEATEARYWFPSHDFPNEKFTSEVICRVPAGMVALSNGRLVSEEKDEAGGRNAFHWAQEKPHVNYLISLAAGYFEKIEDKYRNVPLAFYTSPSDIDHAANSFRPTKEAMEFFEAEIGVPFPWAKYYQVAVKDFMFGGMENTSITTLTDRTLFSGESENLRTSEGLVAHELAHQWFGDLVTCKDWSHIWLNEGFATFYANLFEEHVHGREAMLYNLYNASKQLAAAASDTRPIVYRRYADPEDLFRSLSHLVYGKGGWVLHMLRSELGPELYRRCIKTYLERRQFGTAQTSDLVDVIEELSGRSFDKFFDQWVFHGGIPELDAAYSWDAKTKLARITLTQNQKTSEEVLLFRLPLTVRFKTKTSTTDRDIVLEDKSKDFYFPLAEEPLIVRLDPHLAVLAKIHFPLPNGMLYNQIEEKDDALGRLLAVDALADKSSHETIARLKTRLNQDSFYGVRIAAANALRLIHNDEAFTALTNSLQQSDARVRSSVAANIGAFYGTAPRLITERIVRTEKNPVIVAQSLGSLGAYPKEEISETLLRFLRAESYRNELAEAALGAIRAQDDSSYVQPVLAALQTGQTRFTSPGFARGLDTLAYLARHDDDKQAVRAFLSSQTESKRDPVRVAALQALGTLGDPRAIALLEKFVRADKDDPAQRAAAKAVSDLRAGRKPSAELTALRNEVLDLQKKNQQLDKELDSLKKRFEASFAQTNAGPSQPKKRSLKPARF